jgi:hypothetical protein
MKFHPSSIGKIMTTPKLKGETLSQGAKTYIRKIAKEDFFGYNTELDNKFINKGKEQEQDSIDLINLVRFTNYEKNKTRVDNEWLTGECDILLEDKIIDVKTSWSLETWPATPGEAHDSEYEWQGRCYMMLYDKPLFELSFCMVTTKDEFLNQWENLSIHRVDHIDPVKRITSVIYERDLEKEEMIRDKCIFASEYYSQYINELNEKQ